MRYCNRGRLLSGEAAMDNWWFPIRHRGTPFFDPFIHDIDGIFHYINHPFSVPPHLWKPAIQLFYAIIDDSSKEDNF